MKRIGSILLALALLLSLAPARVIAAPASGEVSGTAASAGNEAPVAITDAEGLAAIRENLAGSYVLQNDIDLTEALAEGGALYNEEGWIALGYDPVSSRRVDFTGTLDGAGHTITGLQATGFAAALFWSNRGVIRNLKLENGTLIGSNPSTSFAAIGSFCCFNAGLIANCSSGLTVDNTGKPNDYTGGIVGLNYSAGVIWDCVNTGTVKTGHTFEDNTGVLAVGGITGCNYGTVRNCGNTGAVLAQAAATEENQFSAAWPYVVAGGIAGENTGVMERIWNRGSVTADYPWLKSYPAVAAGGLVGRTGTETRQAGESMAFTLRDGYNAGPVSARGFHGYAGGIIGIYAPYGSQAIFRCYNAGEVTAATIESQYEPPISAAGAICGYERGAAELLTDCYYLDNMAAAVGTSEDHSCISVTDAQLRRQETFVDYDFETVWDMGTGDYLYPVLERHVHVLSHAEYLEPTCFSDGHVEYWFCPGCDSCFADEAGSQPMDWADTVLPGGHIYQVTDVVAPTCTEQGYTVHTCARCGDSYSDTWTEALGHLWGEPGYAWSDDLIWVTAHRICTRDESHFEEETAQTTSRVTLEPTYWAEGEIEYTAVFENPAFPAQVRTAVLPKLELPCRGYDCPGFVFTDMPAKTHWAHDPIDWAYVNRITAGTTHATFSPNKGCSRAEVVTFLWKASGAPEPTEQGAALAAVFTDVDSAAYYYRPLKWALEHHVTAGTSTTTFGPNSICTRAQAVTFLWRAAGSPEPTGEGQIRARAFTDVAPGVYYERALWWALENHVTAGTSATTFGPNDTCTRAQVVTFLYKAAGN